MSNEDRKKPAPVLPIPAGESAIGSGEGAKTALEALIRKRKQADKPADDPDVPPEAVPPVPPGFPAAATP